MDERWEMELEPVTTAAGVARQRIQDWLGGGDLPEDRLDDLMLIGSELVTNAVVHARTPLRLVVRYDGSRALAEVYDENRRLPQAAHVATDGGGRGLFLIDALSRRWGWERAG